MIIVDSVHHIIFSNKNVSPDRVCQGDCQRVWWSADSGNSCKLCGSLLAQASEIKHFNVLTTANRKLKISDVKKYSSIPSKEKKQLQQIISKGLLLNDISVVKPQFEIKAKELWVKE